MPSTMSSTTTPTNKEWTIHYHGGKDSFPIIKGRAEFLRLMLEDAQADYEVTNEHLYGPQGMMDSFRGSPEAVLNPEANAKFPNPVFFPPVLWHRPKGTNGEQDDDDDVLINQVGACCMYLGEQLGYAPSSSKEKALANTIALNALDYIAEGRASFHPVNNTASYSDQKEEGDKASLEFTKTRMPIWLTHFCKIVAQQGPNSPVAGGPKITYADFCLFQVLDATIAQFNNAKYNHVWDNHEPKIDELKDYHSWMASRPNLQAYFASDRVPPYAGDSMM